MLSVYDPSKLGSGTTRSRALIRTIQSYSNCENVLNAKQLGGIVVAGNLDSYSDGCSRYALLYPYYFSSATQVFVFEPQAEAHDGVKWQRGV